MEKIVNFHEYCPSCKYEKTDEAETPCNECLNNPSNEDSHKPIYYKEK